MFGNFAAALTSQSISGGPRTPPLPPTSLEFPQLSAQSIGEPVALSRDEIIRLFSSVPRNGPSINYIRALNIQVTLKVNLEQLIPADYLPPPTWLAEATPAAGSENTSIGDSGPKLLSNGAVAPDQAAFCVRAKELGLSNESAFAFLERRPQPYGPSIRIAHFRKFWDDLFHMAQYWDTSLDKYTTAPESHRATLRTISRSPMRRLSRSPFRKRSRSPARHTSPTRSPESPTPETYTGRRISNGANMPPQYRESAVINFVEAVAWAFRCCIERPKTEPKLEMGGMRVPIMQTASIYRTPRDSQKARKRVMEGPLMGVQCQNVQTFRKESEKEGEGKGEILHFLRETGLALMIAQKRMREGSTESTTWKGKWWVEERRWGGGTGKQISTVELASLPKDARSNDELKEVPQRYVGLHPPVSTWEKNVEYMQIGKDGNGPFDDIYLVSALNHHISIVRFRIAQQYTKFITSAGNHSSCVSAEEDAASSQEPWSVLSVQRSRWYDLLQVDDRVDAMRGLWGIMGWLMRDTENHENDDVQMGGTEA